MTPSIDELRRWVGRSESAIDWVTPRLVAGWRATIGPLDAVEAAGVDPLLGLHWCLCPPATPVDEVGPDGHARRGGFLPPVPLPRRMWAGGEVTLLDRLVEGDAVERRSTIRSVEGKQGRSGALIFVAVEHLYRTVRGPALEERHDIVYRELPAPGAMAPSAELAGEPEPGERVAAVEAGAVLLFRYSALTFNSHRIHYDHPYATLIEGYDGLVVHGPLQATLMLRAGAAALGRPARRFSYRGLAPLTAGDAFAVRARAEDGGAATRVVTADGRVTMTGAARADEG
jgi:3-methylfumaryl-CoA hydratase